MPDGIHGVIFDLGGTLGGPSGDTEKQCEADFLSYLCKHQSEFDLGRHESVYEIVCEFRRQVQQAAQLKNDSECCIREFILADCLAHLIDLHPTHRIVKNALQAYYTPATQSWRPYAGMRLLLQSLRTRGIPLALVSNTTCASKQYSALQAIQLQQYFSVIVFSSDVAIRKPDARIFDHVLAQWNAHPSTVVMVGDMLNRDILGANRCGIHSIWLPQHAGNESCNERYKTNIVPDFTANSVAELSDTLDTLLIQRPPAKPVLKVAVVLSLSHFNILQQSVFGIFPLQYRRDVQFKAVLIEEMCDKTIIPLECSMLLVNWNAVLADATLTQLVLRLIAVNDNVTLLQTQQQAQNLSLHSISKVVSNILRVSVRPLNPSEKVTSVDVINGTVNGSHDDYSIMCVIADTIKLTLGPLGVFSFGVHRNNVGEIIVSHIQAWPDFSILDAYVGEHFANLALSYQQK